MTNLRKPPGTVIGGAVISGVFAVMFAVMGAVLTLQEGPSGLNIGLIVVGLILALAIRLIWRGDRAGQIVAVVFGALFVATSLRLLFSNATAVVFLAGGLAMIVLLTAPERSRDHFSTRRRAAAT